jgi:hypothetical protein
MAHGDQQIDRLVKQHKDLLDQRKIRLEEKIREKSQNKSPFEGSCLSMNKNVSHEKTYRKTQRALMKV